MSRWGTNLFCGGFLVMASMGAGQNQTPSSAPQPVPGQTQGAATGADSCPVVPADTKTSAATDASPGTTAPQALDKDAQRTAERAIDTRDANTMGIIVEQPKVYDDSLLQQMLKADQAKLLSLQGLDQASITSHLGSVTGATQSISSFSLSLQGPSLPQVATTNTGATNTTETGDTNTVTTTTPSTSTTTTSPQTNAPTVTAPAPTTSLPSSYSVSSQNVVEEQMQLTYEIANLQLLLEGSLSDWTIGTSKIVKPRVTLGFPITIAPDKRDEDATAVIEVEIEKDPNTNPASDEPPAIITLLPREKTYNVARITDNSFAVSAGVAVQAISVGGAYGRGTKTYYLVKDIDTMALPFRPDDATKRVGFRWEFRPVLGQRYVKAGMKQAFVQIAFPSKADPANFGRIHVRTYWKYYDRKQGYAKKVRSNSLQNLGDAKGWPIPYYSETQNPRQFNADNISDLGNGQVMVTLPGRYLGGTSIRIGSTFLGEGNTAFRSDYNQIRFVATVADLATKDVAMVSRDGTESPLILDYDKCDQSTFKPALVAPKIAVTPADDSNTLITATFDGGISSIHDKLPLVMVLGNKVYGYSDAPIHRTDSDALVKPKKTVLSVLVPTSAVLTNPTVTFRSILTSRKYWVNGIVPVLTSPQGSQTPKLVLLEQSDAGAKFLLYGSDLDSITIESPEKMKSAPLTGDDGKTLQVVTLSKDQLKSEKQLVFKTGKNLRFAIAFPKADATDTSKYTMKPLGTVVVGDDQVVFQGDGIQDLQQVTFNDAELKIRKQQDNKMVWVQGLKAAGVTKEAKKQSLVFVFKAGKLTVDLTVVAKP